MDGGQTDQTMPAQQLTRLEQLKFRTDPEDPTKVIVQTSAKGTFTPQGLTKEGRITRVTVTDSAWAALPTTALADRNAISIQNRSGFEVAINFSNTALYADSWPLPDGFELHYSVKDTIIIYAKAASGAGSVSILVQEVA